MEVYKKITGYENYVGEKNFNNGNKWTGYIIGDETGWFEGISSEENDISSRTDKLLFGIDSENKDGLYFYKVSPRAVCEPHIVACSQTEEGLDGDIYALSFTGPTHIGLARLKVEDITKEDLPKNFLERLTYVKEKNPCLSSYDSLRERVTKVGIKQYKKVI